jgi:SAM-dependent methyltransferase
MRGREGWPLERLLVGVVVEPVFAGFEAGDDRVLPFPRGALLTSIIAAIVMLALIGSSMSLDSYNLYSPYQVLAVSPVKNGAAQIMVNHLFYQNILDLGPNGPGMDGDRPRELTYYGLPYQFQKSPDDVLVVGAGSGNDVAAALRHGAGHVDAVEIDPLILQLGRMLHPESPYASDRVTPHVQDARAFFRSTDKKFDLIVYGLLDSHTALSGMSGVRLDSYIYTIEAFKQARKCLKDNGILCLSFAVGENRQAEKLSLMLRQAFDGQRPRVLKAPTGSTVFVISSDSSALSIALPGDVLDLTGYVDSHHFGVDVSTDDWPFFYMPNKTFPVTYVFMIAILMVVAALFIWPVLKLEGSLSTVSWPCLFLGAGFMLLETKAVTELALFYGSTWIVISVVILAILVMAFLANLTIMRFPTIPRGVSYVLLLISLGASLWFSASSGSMHGEWLSRILPTVVLTLPLFFSGLVFSAEMQAAPSVSAALGSNLIGAMIGGCLEYNSMYFGYRSLYVLAMIIYGLSLIVSMSKRTRPIELALEKSRAAQKEQSGAVLK